MSRYIMLVSNLVVLLFLSSCAMTLPKAAETGNSSQIQALLHEGAPVDQRGGSMDETALIIASRHGNLGIVKTLLNAGANINARSKYGDTALTAATYFCHSNVAEFLIEQGADVNAKNDGFGSTPLMLASECNAVETVKALIKRSAKVDEKNKGGMTALMAASIKGHGAVAQILLDAGASANESWGKGTTILYEAAQQGHDPIVKSLIERGADVNAVSNNNGWTPLMISVAEGHASTAVILLQAGAKPNVANSQGRSALMFAAWYGNKEIVAMLLKAGADPNLVPNDKEGMTALIAATKKKNKDVVAILLNGGANPNVKDKSGKAAIAYANSSIAPLLRQAGAKE